MLLSDRFSPCADRILFERPPPNRVKCHMTSSKPQGSRLRRFWNKELWPMLVLALIVFSIRSSLADWNDVPTGSMKPTIVEGDRVFVNKLAYDLKVPFTTWRVARWSDPAPGEVVIFYSPVDGERMVKRVAGGPRDTVQMIRDPLIRHRHPLPDGPRHP